MLIITLIGMPGAGKGTQAKILTQKYGLEHLSIGDILRSSSKNNEPLGIKAKAFMDKGNLVPDDVIIGLVDEKLNKQKFTNGLLLDGYPRNLAQAKSLDKTLAKLSLKLTAAIYLKVSKDVMISRLAGRRVSEKTGREYHIVFKPPKKEGFCDIDNSRLIQRADDKPDKILNRMEVFNKSTTPIISYYKELAILKEVDADDVPAKVAEKIFSYI